MKVVVHNNDITKLRTLKKKMQNEGIFNELRERTGFKSKKKMQNEGIFNELRKKEQKVLMVKSREVKKETVFLIIKLIQFSIG